MNEKTQANDQASNLPKLAAPAQRALAGAGYTRLEQLTRVTEADVKKLHGMGPKAMTQLRQALDEADLHLPMAPEDTAAGDYVAGNRAAWDRMATDYFESGHRNWADDVVTWGIFNVSESEIGMFPADVNGLDVVELGCGTAYISAWLARRGARPVGIDNSPAQLENARSFQREFDLDFPLHLGNAEQTPFADESFDFSISEYGAAIWCDPYRWIPEAARILRPGGRLSFLGNSILLMLATPASDEDLPVTEQLERPLFGMHRFDWADGASEFHLPHGEMIRLLRDSGFEIEDLVEVQIPEGATTTYPFVSPAWARRWPCEEVWKVRKR